jgi:hypothetical protein
MVDGNRQQEGIMESFLVEVRTDRWVFTPVSARARKWVANNLFANTIKVERGYVPCVIRALLAEGFAIVPSVDAASGAEE